VLQIARPRAVAAAHVAEPLRAGDIGLARGLRLLAVRTETGGIDGVDRDVRPIGDPISTSRDRRYYDVYRMPTTSDVALRGHPRTPTAPRRSHAFPVGHNARVELLDRVREFFSTHGAGIAAAYVFGSVGRAEARADSDLDVGVLLATDPPRTLEGLQLDLADALAGAVGRRVDLVVLNHAPADLVHRVLRDGQLVLERDRSARVRFEVRRRNEYFDLLPVLEEYRRPRHRDETP